jgi:hypothetical protein
LSRFFSGAVTLVTGVTLFLVSFLYFSYMARRVPSLKMAPPPLSPNPSLIVRCEIMAGIDGGGILNKGTLTLTDTKFKKNDPNDCVDSVSGTGCP